jgi:hypothetical protein
LNRIPSIAAASSEAKWDEIYTRTVAAAIAVSKGQPALGEAILELDPESVKDLMEARFG